jgi:hypothetical protein
MKSRLIRGQTELERQITLFGPEEPPAHDAPGASNAVEAEVRDVICRAEPAESAREKGIRAADGARYNMTQSEIGLIEISLFNLGTRRQLY